MHLEKSGFTACHFTFQELSKFFKTSETLEAMKKEKQIQDRWVSTTLLAANSLDTIDTELLRAAGFDPKKAPVIILPDAKTMSESGDSALDSDQEPSRTGNPKSTTPVHTQSHPEAVETGQASNKCHADLSKPSTSLPTLAVAQALHLTIDSAQVGWLNCFLTNMDIPNDVYLKHQQCGVNQDTPKFYLCPQEAPTTVYHHGVLPWGHDTALAYAYSQTTLSWEFGAPGWARMVVENRSASPVVKAMPHTWQSLMGLMPPGTLMFLTTEWFGTGWALLLFHSREQALVSSHNDPHDDFESLFYVCSCWSHGPCDCYQIMSSLIILLLCLHMVFGLPGENYENWA